MKNLYLGLFLNLVFGVGSASAVTNTWVGAANGDWFNTNNWTMSAVPGDGDTVMITNSAVLLTNSTALLEWVVVTNATVTFTNWTTALKAMNVTLRNRGKFTCAGCNTNGAPGNTNRVYVLCSNMTVEAGGSVFVDGLGYAGAQAVNTKGQGPGGGFYSSSYGGGGGYGGAGGSGYGGAGGPAYSTENDASQPGSGGGRGTSITPGNGGGAVWIEATGTLTLGGSITANGANGYHGGSGSGGGITIQCGIFDSSEGSSITADGGTCTVNGGGGGGGGGRIVLSCTQTTPGAAVYLSADYGVRAAGTGSGFPGELGSIKVTETELLPETGRMNGVLYGVAAWNASQWSFTNSHLEFGEPGLALTVTNDMLLGTNSTFFAMLSNCVLRVNGNLTLTNAASMSLRSASTNGAGVYTNHGGRLSVGGTMAVYAGSTVTLVPMRDDSGAIKCEVGNLRVASGAVIHSDYLGGYGGTSINTSGSGEGGGAYGTYGAGGGHGGRGGNSQSGAAGGGAYGDSNAPVRCGSGGGSRPVNTFGGNGGGVVWICSPGTFEVDGMLSARGQAGINQCGCGAGGAIYLACDTFAGGSGATVTVKGASTSEGSGNTYGGGGAGGRIAIYRRTDSFGGTVTAAGGTSESGQAGESGTVVRTTDPNVSYVFLPVVASPPPQRGTPLPYYGANGFIQGSSVTNCVASPADEANGMRYACVGWILTNDAGLYESGVTTQKVVGMTTNATLTWIWTNVYQLSTDAAPNGGLLPDRSGWYTNGTPVSVTCVPDAGYHFSQWSGDCPAGSVTSNPLTIMMDQPRTVRAHVASNTAQVKIWSGTGNWFDDASLWSPAGAPGSGDVVVVSAGAVTVTDPASMKSLTVSNAGSVQVTSEGSRVDVAVDGTVKVDGAAARISCTNANLQVHGDLLVTNGAALVLVSGATNGGGNAYGGLMEVGGMMGVATTSVVRIVSDSTNGGSFKLVVGGLTLDGGGVNADAAGWAGGSTSHAEGYGPGHGHAGTYGGGAGYGGAGGAALTGSGAKGMAYGSSNAPTMPGSGGAANGSVPGGRGGGLVWVESVGNITLNGRVSANGEPASPHSGAGSGGGIYFNCRQLKGNSAGRLAADGGHVLGGGGCGGGGRIAVICRSLSWGYTNQVSVLGGTNATHPEPEIQGQLGTVYWKILGPFGTVISIR